MTTPQPALVRESQIRRKRRFANALESLGQGGHRIGEIAKAMNDNTPSPSSIRQQAIRKDIIFSPHTGLVRFRVPLTATYLNDLNRDFND